jgi:hypothetical protein
MVLIPLVPRPLGQLRLLMHALPAPAATQTVRTPAGAQTPAGAPPGAPPSPAPSPPACEAASEDEEDAALALRFGFHV